MEAEYVASYVATHETIWLESFLQDLNHTLQVDDPIEMLCDNIQLTKDPKLHRKTKHIKRPYHFVRDDIKTKEIAIK